MATLDTQPAPAQQTTSTAQTATSNPNTQQDGWSSLFIIVIVWGAVLYFFFMRPQKKKEASRKELLSQLKKGDRVVTIGGIHGAVVHIKDDVVSLKIDDKNGTTIKVQRAAINDVPDEKKQ